MRFKNLYLLMALLIAIGLVAGGCGAGSGSPQNVTESPNPVIPTDNPPGEAINPNPLFPEGPLTKSLNNGESVTDPAEEECGESFILDTVKDLCDLFALFSGEASCLNYSSSCNTYPRQIYAGSVIDSSDKDWNGRGGSGRLMADAAVCTLRELSPKLGGPVLS
ncbi:MAG: hypothetical protein HY954_11730, partial [Deltaproteobacteria bacterium]|nr:hypothetical protein [Deltaproteobacteria bacterium]